METNRYFNKTENKGILKPENIYRLKVSPFYI